jgi:RNA polymerase sigma-70 factor (ECF subfamily)
VVTPEARAEIQALLVRLSEGDRSAVEPTFRALWPILAKFSARALGGAAEGEDAAQQAIVKVFGQAVSFDPKRDGLAWALTIAAYECRTVRRRTGRRREEGVEAAALRATHETPEALAVQRDLVEAANEVLGSLREEDARAILAALGDARPEGDATFRKRLQRALARLRLAWRTKHGT